MAERDKPSSLRTRVDRARKGYSKPMNPMPIIIGAVFVIGAGAALFFAFREPPTPYGGERAPAQKAPQPAAASQPKAAAPRKLSSDPRAAVMQLTRDAKQAAATDADAALRKLEKVLGDYPDFAPSIYHSMAMVVEKKILKGGGNNAPRRLFREKLDYLLKAKDELDAGKKWAYDPHGNRTGNLNMSIEQAEKEANK